MAVNMYGKNQQKIKCFFKHPISDFYTFSKFLMKIHILFYMKNNLFLKKFLYLFFLSLKKFENISISAESGKRFNKNSFLHDIS